MESFEFADLEEEDDLMTDESPLDKLLQAVSQLMDISGGISPNSPQLKFEQFRAKMKK